jgi:hypothetical protein
MKKKTILLIGVIVAIIALSQSCASSSMSCKKIQKEGYKTYKPFKR